MELADRVAVLVSRHSGGNVNASAKAWGVPQPTLRRIVKGINRRTNAEALHRIAQANYTTVEWLLNGDGARQWGIPCS